MRKVLFLHGLESPQGGDKVKYLSANSIVHAPAMKYRTTNWSIDKLIDLVDSCNPDLIVGSSMGGYIADVLGSYTGIEVLLFNPALHSRSLDYNLKYGKDGYKRTIILGEDDKVINPIRTKELVGDTAKIVNVVGMGHRTDLNTFKAIYSKYVLDETN
jgi:predicted esterase YcpF (UPF0227 family)